MRLICPGLRFVAVVSLHLQRLVEMLVKIAPYEQYLTSVPNHQTSSYCGSRPILQEATPSDLVIVCSEYSLQIQPETSSVEEEVVLFP